jgi:hypothetical protein|tara:strand:- start:853 stop:1104 length:252 start_codon:yes stop_codon:yes gene_type:complete
MKTYIRTVNGLVNLEHVEAISWKPRDNAGDDDAYPFMIIFFLRSGTTFLANASAKSLHKTQNRFKELWTQEEDMLDISGEDEE